MGLQWKKLGLWDYTLFEIGITEIMFEIGTTGFQSNQGFQIQICPSVFLRYNFCSVKTISNWDYRTPPLTGP